MGGNEEAGSLWVEVEKLSYWLVRQLGQGHSASSQTVSLFLAQHIIVLPASLSQFKNRATSESVSLVGLWGMWVSAVWACRGSVWNNTRYFVAGICWVFFSHSLHLGHSAYNPTISSLKKNKNYLQVTFKTKGEAILNLAIFHFWHLVPPQALRLQIMLVGNGSFYAHLKKEGLYIMNRTRIKELAV